MRCCPQSSGASAGRGGRDPAATPTSTSVSTPPPSPSATTAATASTPPAPSGASAPSTGRGRGVRRTWRSVTGRAWPPADQGVTGGTV